jgi:hypothetical protein
VHAQPLGQFGCAWLQNFVQNLDPLELAQVSPFWQSPALVHAAPCPPVPAVMHARSAAAE